MKVNILHIDSIDDSFVESLLPLLPDWRRERALSYKHSQGRKESVLSFLLLKSMLKEEFGIDDNLYFEYSEHGKPFLPNRPDIHFNISHCAKAVACVVCDEEVGIDVECRGRYRESIAQHVLNNEELKSVHDSDDSDLTFTEFWTCKEAILKLTGNGVSSDMKETIARNPDIHVVTAHDEQVVWTIAYI